MNECDNIEELKEELELVKTQLNGRDEKLAELANMCYALQQNLRMIETKYPSTLIMADCIRISDGVIDILQR